MATCVVAVVHVEAGLCSWVGRSNLPIPLSFMAASAPSRAAGAGLGFRQACQAEPGARTALPSQMKGCIVHLADKGRNGAGAALLPQINGCITHLASEGECDCWAACRGWATPSAWQASSYTITSRCRKVGRRMPALAPRGMAAMWQSLTRLQRLKRGMSRCRICLARSIPQASNKDGAMQP